MYANPPPSELPPPPGGWASRTATWLAASPLDLAHGPAHTEVAVEERRDRVLDDRAPRLHREALMRCADEREEVVGGRGLGIESPGP